MNLLILDRKKYIPALILCLAVLICMIIVVIFNSSSDSETTLPGTWTCLDQPEIQMEIKEQEKYLVLIL